MNKAIERVLGDVSTAMGVDTNPSKVDWKEAFRWFAPRIEASIIHMDKPNYLHRDTLISAAAALIGMVARYAPYPSVGKGTVVVLKGEKERLVATVLHRTDTPDNELPSDGSLNYHMRLEDGTEGVWNSSSIVGIVQ